MSGKGKGQKSKRVKQLESQLRKLKKQELDAWELVDKYERLFQKADDKAWDLGDKVATLEHKLWTLKND